MKKVILILFCLALTLNFASAVAETAEKTAIGTISMNGAFELRGMLPEGYQLTVIMEEPGHYLASLCVRPRSLCLCFCCFRRIRP